jgi:hypothetical protein
MKQLKIDIVIFIGLLILSSIILLLTAGQSAIDIQLHDTYFVFDKISLTVLIIGPLTFLIFLARGLTTKFNAMGTNIGLIVGLILNALITYQIVRLQQSYLNEVMLNNEGSPGSQQLIIDANNKLRWTWGLFVLWVTGLLLLTFRNIQIWKGEYRTEGDR